MPIPFILIGIAAGTSIYGAVKGIKAARKRAKAIEMAEAAKKLYQEAASQLKKAHDETTSTLNTLGQLKLNTWDQQLGRFADLFEWLKDVEVTGTAQVGELQRIKEELAQIKQISFNASGIVQGGAVALGAGALAGVATYGGATMLASASTGTAIASLSGAAATNATLAWFGGGSLAAGGLGMAGGMCVLGGIIAAPVLAVGGLVFEAKAREMVAQAQKDYALARQCACEMKNAKAITRAIQKAANLCHNTIERLRDRVNDMLDEFEEILISNLHQAEVALKKSKRTLFTSVLWFFGIGRPKKLKTLKNQSKEGRRISYLSIPECERQKIYLTVETVQILKKLLEMPLLDNAGALRNDYQHLIEETRKYFPISNS